MTIDKLRTLRGSNPNYQYHEMTEFEHKNSLFNFNHETSEEDEDMQYYDKSSEENIEELNLQDVDPEEYNLEKFKSFSTVDDTIEIF